MQEAIDGDAIRTTGGSPLTASLYPCTVLKSPPTEARVSTQEIFGPVVCVYPFDDEAEVVTQANSLPLAFQAAVYTESIETALKFYRELDASAVMINDHSAFRTDGMRFAGLRQSGLGVGGIPYTMDDMRIDKMAVIRSPHLVGDSAKESG